MAKPGEGDPRWIVENRSDGTNVNNWHWTERNLFKWGKKQLEEMLTNYTLHDGDGVLIKTKKIEKIEGELVSNNRKGKTIFIFELDLRISWIANSKDADGFVETTGEFHYPDLSQDNKDDQQEVTIKFDSSPHVDRIKPLVNSKAKPQLQQRIAEFLKIMREEHTIKEGAYSPLPPSELEKKAASPSPVSSPQVSQAKSGSRDVKIEMPLGGSADEIYLSLIDPGRLMALTAGSAQMEPVPGGKFSLFGSISGENVELIPGKKIVQKWRFNDWAAGHFSTVTITLEPSKKSNGCILKLVQVGVPANDYDRTAQGWRSNILERMKMVFGFGPMAF